MKKLFVSSVLILVLSQVAFSQQSSESVGNGKNMGMAINPVLLLFNWGSAEVNFWNFSRSAEINVPIQFASNPFSIEKDDDNLDVRLFSIGAYYRYFFSEQQRGFFAQAGWIYSHASVEEAGEETSGNQNSILFGFGYRLISKKGFFWGCALAVGKTWGTIKDPDGDEVKGSGFAFDIDLLKFGYCW